MSSLLSNPNPNQPQLDLYEDVKEPINSKQRWKWRIHVSGRIVAASSEGYDSKQGAIRNLVAIEQHIKSLRENNKLV